MTNHRNLEKKTKHNKKMSTLCEDLFRTCEIVKLPLY